MLFKKSSVEYSRIGFAFRLRYSKTTKTRHRTSSVGKRGEAWVDKTWRGRGKTFLNRSFCSVKFTKMLFLKVTVVTSESIKH